MDGEALLGSSITDLINTKDEAEDLAITSTEESARTEAVSLSLEEEGRAGCVVCGLEGEEMIQPSVTPECGENDSALHGTQDSEPVSESLLSRARQEVGQALPQEMARLESLLTELQEDTDNTRSLIQETYHSYRAILEQCMNYSLAELEKRQQAKELAIMEKLEEIDNTKRHLEMSLLWHEKSIKDGHRSNAGKLVSDRMESLMKYRQVSLVSNTAL